MNMAFASFPKPAPPSGQSTTVTFTYEITEHKPEKSKEARRKAWLSLRGIAKDVFAAYGGGEAYLREERANFYASGRDPFER